MRVLVPGIAGFIGMRLLGHLLEAGHEVVGIVRSASEIQRLPSSVQVRYLIGDVTDPEKLVLQLPSTFDACIYLPGLLREFPNKGITFQKVHTDGVRNLLTICKERGAKRWLQMSALGVGRGYQAGYYRTKLEAEHLVQQSGLDWTIFRPSVVFSETFDPKLNFVSELGDVLRKTPVMPVFGDGKYRLQPVSREVLTKAISDSLELPETFGKTFEIGGPDKLEYQDILKIIASALGKKRAFVHIPFGFMRSVASVLDTFSFFPVTQDQLTMLENENIVIDPNKEREFFEIFKPETKHFEDGVRNFYRKR